MPGYIKIFRWLLAAGILLLLVVMGLQCVSVYLSPEPFSRELAAEKLLPMGGVCIAGAAAVLIVSILRRRYAVKEVYAKMSPENRLRLLKKRIDKLPDEAITEEKRRKTILAVIYTLAAVSAIIGERYFLNGNNFVSWDLENVMGDMLMHVLPWTAAAFFLAYVALVLRDISIEKEIVMIKNVPLKKLEAAEISPKNVHLNILRATMLIAALVLIIAGIMNGGARDVLVKAINICTECIGLG